MATETVEFRALLKGSKRVLHIRILYYKIRETRPVSAKFLPRDVSLSKQGNAISKKLPSSPGD